jgi:hypothetical protein
MRMLSKFVVASALGVVLGATFGVVSPVSAEEGKQRFTHEGYTYVYEVKDTKTGQVISGRRYPDAVAFNLAVKKGKVSGISGGQPVAFKLEEARGAISK